MNGSGDRPNNAAPNVHIPENKKVLSYLKELHPFHEIIVPFSPKSVSREITPADFIGRFAAMSSLPANSKYVVYGLEALVHPDTGIIFGFITGTNVIYRFPEHLLDEARREDNNNFRVVREMSENGMDGLENNWVSSPSITEPIVRKCFEHYGSVAEEPKELRLDSGGKVSMPSTSEFEEQERWRRWRPLGAVAVVCVLCVLLLYAANYVIRLF